VEFLDPLFESCRSDVFEYMLTCLDELSRPNADIEQKLPWQFAKR